MRFWIVEPSFGFIPNEPCSAGLLICNSDKVCGGGFDCPVNYNCVTSLYCPNIFTSGCNIEFRCYTIFPVYIYL